MAHTSTIRAFLRLAWIIPLTGIIVLRPLAAQGSAVTQSISFDGSRLDRRLFIAVAGAADNHVNIMLSEGSHATQWRKGALIGGVLGAILGFAAGSALGDPDGGGQVSTVGLTVGGAVVGGIAGALIGGLFPREEAVTPLPTH
jgi:hypothetical protein